MNKWTTDTKYRVRSQHRDVDERDITWDDAIGAVSLVALVGIVYMVCVVL